MADEYVVQRSVDVAAPPTSVYERVVDLRRWREWSPWEGLDPDLRRTYGGPDAGVGQTYAWSGNRRAGQGTMAITEAVDGERVAIDLVFEKPFRSESVTTFVLRPAGEGSTRVTWTMRGPKTLVSRVMGLFTSMDRMIGPDFERGLDRLRQVSEASDGG